MQTEKKVKMWIAPNKSPHKKHCLMDLESPGSFAEAKLYTSKKRRGQKNKPRSPRPNVCHLLNPTHFLLYTTIEVA